MGMEQELLRDKDIIWQCVSCNKCTYVCPRDVNPEGVMKALSHWLELKGHTPKSPSMHFDEEFSEQVFDTGKIEESRVIRGFFRRTGQSLMQDWLVALVKRLIRHLPIKLLLSWGSRILCDRNEIGRVHERRSGSMCLSVKLQSKGSWA